MNRLLEYATHHPLLVGAAAALAVLVGVVEFRQRMRGSSTVAPAEAVRLVNKGALVLDVRSPEMFAAGHIIDARNLPMDKLDADVESFRKWREKPVIVYCDSGTTAATVIRRLREKGFNQVVNLRGGLGAWQQENMPLVRSDGARKESRAS
jgi:rhodanese-related sulfurtransferase